MPRYFFDSRDGATLIIDEEGVEFTDPDKVRIIAAKGLAELANDKLPTSYSRCLGIDVRDGDGPVMTTELTFHARSTRFAPTYAGGRSGPSPITTSRLLGSRVQVTDSRRRLSQPVRSADCVMQDWTLRARCAHCE